jgi:hypothetical protein
VFVPRKTRLTYVEIFFSFLGALSLGTNSLINNIPTQLSELTNLGAFSLHIVWARNLLFSVKNFRHFDYNGNNNMSNSDCHRVFLLLF